MSGDDYLFEIPAHWENSMPYCQRPSGWRCVYVANPYSPELRIALGVIWKCHDEEVAAAQKAKGRGDFWAGGECEARAQDDRSLAWLILHELHDATAQNRPDHIHSAACEQGRVDCPIYEAGCRQGWREAHE